MKKVKDYGLSLDEALEAAKHLFARETKLDCFREGVVTQICLPMKPEFGCSTACVTPGGLTFWHEEFVNSLTVRELAHVLAHEYLHPVLWHLRLQPEHMDWSRSDHRFWHAVAIDIDVHRYVELALPDSTPSAAWTFEGAKAKGLRASSSATAEQLWYVMRDQNWLVDELAAGTVGPMDDHGGGEAGDEADAEMGRGSSVVEAGGQDLAKRIQEESSKLFGSNAGESLLLWAEKRLRPPRIPWSRMVVNTVHGVLSAPGAGGSELDYSTAHLFQGMLGWEPGSPRLPVDQFVPPKLTVVVDSSGSMYGVGTDVLSEMVGLSRHFELSAFHLVVGDTQVHYSGDMPNVDEVREYIKGGCGTDFVPLVREAERIPSDLYVFFTDGYGSAPSKVKGKWVTVIVPGGRAPDSIRGWGGDIIQIAYDGTGDRVQG